jgi:hypothetical protein
MLPCPRCSLLCSGIKVSSAGSAPVKDAIVMAYDDFLCYLHSAIRKRIAYDM